MYHKWPKQFKVYPLSGVDKHQTLEENSNTCFLLKAFRIYDFIIKYNMYAPTKLFVRKTIEFFIKRKSNFFF